MHKNPVRNLSKIMEPVIGIISGSGLDDPNIFTGREEKVVQTPFGDPSDTLIFGNIAGIKCVLLARHGRKHQLSPTNVNYRANIWALKHVGCTCVVVSCAVGSLQENIQPGHIVILDQFLDRTKNRKDTFYDGTCQEFSGISHIPMAHPFASELNELLSSTLKERNFSHHSTGTIVVIEGPRFSSKAESLVWQSFGASVVGMTTVPEVVLANEIGLPYAAIALVTDMDAWREGPHVTVDMVMKQMTQNAESFKHLLVNCVPKLKALDWKAVAQKYKAQADEAVM